MSDLNIGQFVKSLAGHDKGCVYVVCKIEGNRCSLVDGRLRLLSNPKQKSRKHLQPIRSYASELLGMNQDEPLTTDEQIKRAIKLYEKQHTE